MWKSKQNEIGVVILRTGMTHHHLYELEKIYDPNVDITKYFRKCVGGNKLGRYIPVPVVPVSRVSNQNNDDNDNDDNEDEEDVVYPNLVELELSRPSPLTLQTIQSVQCTINNDIASSIRGDICAGLILAADTLHRRTNGKKYNRKIVLFTDAEHEVDVHGEQLNFVLGELKKMEVELLVVGIGFQETKDEEGKPEAVSSSTIHEKPDAVVSMENGDNSNTMSMMVKEEEGNPDDIIDNDTNILVELIKRENEKLLHSIVREVGGSILIANGSTSLTNVLHTKLPNVSGLTNSMGKNMEFRVAPDLTIMIKSAKLTSQLNLPSTIKEAYQYDPSTGEKLRDGNGELMTLPTRTQTDHYDDEGNVVTFDKRTDAFRYGSDLIPVGKMDLLGISAAFTDPGSIEMMGYIDRKVVEDSNLLIGPAYAITGGAESKKSRSAIAALAMALDETSMIGLCRIVRAKNGEPKIGALIPKLVVERDDDTENSDSAGIHGVRGAYLAFLGLPFADDMQHNIVRRVPSEYHGDSNNDRACDNLIDSMMLPDDYFMSEQIPYPALVAYRRMIAHFAMNPMDANEEMNADGLAEERIMEASRARPLCEFDIVKAVHKSASSQIDEFTCAFPLVEHKAEDDKKRKFWGDGVTD